MGEGGLISTRTMLASFIRRSLFITTRILFVIQYFNLKLSISTTAFDSPLKNPTPHPQLPHLL